MTDPGAGESREARPTGSAGRELAVVAGLVVVLAAVALWAVSAWNPATRDGGVTPSKAAAGSEFVGARSCRECHPGPAAQQSRSGHAHTLRPAAAGTRARWLDGREAPDLEFPGATWSYALRDGQLVATRVVGDRREDFPLDYAFGSGRHATTFVSLLGRDPDGRPTAREHRLSYFAHRDGLDVTPGERAEKNASGRAPEGRSLTGEQTRACFGCHVTRLARDRPDELDVATMILGVSCERCHGPGRAHVEAARRGGRDLSMPFGHGAEPAETEVRFCGACHRLPEFVPPDQVRPDNALLARFQPIGLLRSRCFTAGGGRLRCTTCHDPHARTSRDPAVYESACLSCHGAGRATACPVEPRTGCVGCHMPRRDAGDGMLFTDHWIAPPPPPGGPPAP